MNEYNLFQFSEEDLKTTLEAFESFIDREDDGKIPWNAINYLVTDVFYGGKLTGTELMNLLLEFPTTFYYSRSLGSPMFASNSR